MELSSVWRRRVSPAEERGRKGATGVGKWKIVEAGGGPALAQAQGQVQLNGPEAPLTPLYLLYRHRPLQVSSRSASGACQCPGPPQRAKVPVRRRSRGRSTTSACAHPSRHAQRASGQYKYMKLAASAALIPFLCPFGPLLTLSDCPSFLLLPRSLCSCLDSILFCFSNCPTAPFCVSSSDSSPQRNRTGAYVICAYAHPKILKFQSADQHLHSLSSQQSHNPGLICPIRAGIRKYANRRKRLPPATSTAFLFLEPSF